MPDFIINTDDNVYVPAEDSYLLAETMFMFRQKTATFWPTIWKSKKDRAFWK